MSIIKLQSKVSILNRSTAVQDSQGNWRVELQLSDGNNVYSGNNISEGDLLLFNTSGVEASTITIFRVTNLVGYTYNSGFPDYYTVDMIYDESNDNTVQINDLNSLPITGVISRPTSSLGLMATIAPGTQGLADYWAEYVSNINLERLDSKLTGILGLDSNGDYVPQGSTANTSISDDIKELFENLSNNSGNSNVTVSATAPENPSEGDLWWDSEAGSLKIYYTSGYTDTAGDDAWVEISSSGSVTSSNLINISDNAEGVVVTGKVAADSLEIGFGGSITSQGGTKDFRYGIVNFSGADVAGLGDTIDGQVDFHLNKDNSVVGDQVLSWNGTDYEWVDLPDLSGYATNTELSLRDSHLIHVDQYKSGNYIPDGSINKPYKKIQEAYDSAVAVSTILIAPGLYEEDLVVGANGLSSMINFIGLGGKGSNNVVILGNVEIHNPETKIQMKDIRIESPVGTKPALLVNGCRNSSFQNMIIKYGDSAASTATENVLKVTSTGGTGDGIVDFLSCSIFPQGNGILVDGPNGRQVRFYRCNYGANITMPSTNEDTVYLYQCAAFGNMTHVSGVLVVDQSQITGVNSTAPADPAFPATNPTKNFLQVTNSSLRDASNGGLRGDINKTGTSLYLIGNNDSNPDNTSHVGTSFGDFMAAAFGNPSLTHLSYSRHAAEDYYTKTGWAGVENVKEALDSLKTDLSNVSESVWTTLSDNDIYYTEGNVGIGLDTPVEKLEVLGNAKITGKILINGVDEKYTDIDLATVQTDETVHYFNIDASLSRLFVLDSPISDDIGLKISNLNLAVGSATNLSVVVKQDSSPTLISYIEIDQSPVDIKWQGSNIPAGVAGAMEIFSFTILRETESDYVALSQSIDFS